MITPRPETHSGSVSSGSHSSSHGSGASSAAASRSRTRTPVSGWPSAAAAHGPQQVANAAAEHRRAQPLAQRAQLVLG